MKKYEPLKKPKVDSCVTQAIIRQVQQEDLQAWGQKDIVIPAAAPIVVPQQPSRPLMRHLLHQWLP